MGGKKNQFGMGGKCLIYLWMEMHNYADFSIFLMYLTSFFTVKDWL